MYYNEIKCFWKHNFGRPTYEDCLTLFGVVMIYNFMQTKFIFYSYVELQTTKISTEPQG